MSEHKEPIFLVPESEIKSEGHHRLVIFCSCFVLLMALGILNLYSAGSGDSFFFQHLKRIFLGLIFFAVFGWLVPLRLLMSQAYTAYILTALLLILVLFIGHSAGGAQRWLSLMGFVIQPSEFAKITVAMIVAYFFYTNPTHLAYRLRDLWLLFLLVGGIFLLIFLQPDLGTAGICLLIAVCQIAFIRIDLRSMLIVAGSSIMVAASGWLFFLKDYQKLRVLNLINPNLDPHGSGYNAIQSLVAIGNGGIIGKGFLQGTQTQLQFLPARHTDFIFSVFAEEWGFAGSFFVFILYGLLIYMILEIARHAANSFAALLAVGLGALIFVEFAINVAMVLGLFPVVGMPLPFFSFGGSAVIAMSIAMGMLVSIERHTMGLSGSKKKQDSLLSLAFTGFGFLRKKQKDAQT
jgi:rod shape determining protein RodA